MPAPRIHHCPSCGGPCSDPGAKACEFCSGPLLPMGTPDPRNAVRCSACTALVSAGASFCPRCGDPLAPAEAGEAGLGCPACPGAEPMASWRLQPTSRQPQGHAVHGCRRCGGVWVDRATLEAMIESAVQQGAGDGRAPAVRRRALAMQKVVYRSCSACGHAMARRNFARISGVIVDECRVHGTFFDAGELEDVLTFVRSGGLLLARRRETEELARERRRAESQAPRHPLMSEGPEPLSLSSDVLSGEPDLTVAFLRWAGRWIRNMFR